MTMSFRTAGLWCTALLFLGCSLVGYGSSGDSSLPKNTGTLSVYLAERPITDVKQSWVTVTRASAAGRGERTTSPGRADAQAPAAVKVISGTLIGRVTMPNGAPAVGARVDVYAAGEGITERSWANSAVTLDDGAFKVWALESGSYDVAITYTLADGGMLKAGFDDVLVAARESTALNGGVAVTLSP